MLASLRALLRAAPPGIVRKRDVSFHVLRGHCIKVLNALRRKPAIVFAQVRVICAHRGFDSPSFHVDVRDELINQGVRYPSSWSSVCIVIICRVSVPSRPYGTRCGGFQGLSFKWEAVMDGNQHSGKSIQSLWERDTQNPVRFAGSGVLQTCEPSGNSGVDRSVHVSRQSDLGLIDDGLESLRIGDGQLGEERDDPARCRQRCRPWMKRL